MLIAVVNKYSGNSNSQTILLGQDKILLPMLGQAPPQLLHAKYPEFPF